VGNKGQYILDANVFLEAYKRYYAFDLCPGFWQSIKHHGAEGIAATIDKVWDQLQEGESLDEWKANSRGLLVLSTDEADILSAYGEVIRWAQKQTRFESAAKASFASDPDAWLIAFAKARKLTMVSHEKSEPNSKRIIKIPDVCKAFEIPYSNTFDMLRNLQVSYHWNQPTGTA
jgi:hypothetical protein